MAIPPPLPYSTAGETSAARHGRIYEGLLVALAALCGLGGFVLWSLSRRPPMRDEGDSVFPTIAGIYALLFGAIVATLVLRHAVPRVGRTASLGLNIVLLCLVPFGTAVAVYGLWKVDKDPLGPAAYPAAAADRRRGRVE